MDGNSFHVPFELIRNAGDKWSVDEQEASDLQGLQRR
jgi:hypothetical protein